MQKRTETQWNQRSHYSKKQMDYLINILKHYLATDNDFMTMVGLLK